MNLEVKRYSLKALRALFESRVLAVPEIQREFVWDTKKICVLLDSIHRGFPFGAALVWRTGARNKTQLREKLHILPHYDPTNREIWFIVDGQQRLSVLYHLLCGTGKEVLNADGREIHFDHFYFYAGAPSEGAETFIYRQGKPPNGYVPMNVVLGDGRRAPSLASRTASRVRACRSAILEATFFLQLMDTESLDDVRETFIRINAQGKPVDGADKAFARASNLQVRHLFRSLQARLEPAGFHGLPDEVMLSTLAFWFETGDVGARAWEHLVDRIESGAIERREFDRAWARIDRALPVAVDYLKDRFGVANLSFLPSTQIVSLLSLYFAIKGPGRPSSTAASHLRRWFWTAAVSERYSGRGYRKNLSADVSFMRTLATKGAARLSAGELVPRRFLRHAEYSASSSISRAFFCLLHLQRPRYIEDGQVAPIHAYTSASNRPDRHHIFPRKLLSNHGFTARDYNALPNICLLVARENQSVGQKAPHVYLEDLPHTARARASSLKSHLIPAGTNSAIWESSPKKAFPRFVEERTARIVEAFEEQAGSRLFAR